MLLYMTECLFKLSFDTKSNCFLTVLSYKRGTPLSTTDNQLECMEMNFPTYYSQTKKKIAIII